MAQQILLLTIGLLLGGIVALLFLRSKNTSSDTAQRLFSSMHQTLNERMDRMTQHIDARLRENARAMNESKSFLADRVSQTERTVRGVSTSLGKLEAATNALKTSTDEISSFQNLLKNPQVRGSFGEVLLTNLMSEILPGDRFTVQYTMPSTGEIADAVIKLQDDYIVSVDAKFPLANFEQYARSTDPPLRQKFRSQVIKDIKKHILDIEKKYISPRDKTLDYAFMYIPVEGIYYETMVKGEKNTNLWEFCLQHHVIPVSPNSFLAYLQTILIGLRGLKIEEQAKEILQHLNQIRRDFTQFSDDFSMVGKHLSNAKNRFDDSSRKLDRFNNRLDQIEADTPQLSSSSSHSTKSSSS